MKAFIVAVVSAVALVVGADSGLATPQATAVGKSSAADARITQHLLKNSDIHVETNDHTVTLSGTVMSAAGRARAVTIAKGTKGVKSVVDKLTVGPKKG